MGACRFINVALVSGAALACGVWLQGCSSGGTAAARDAGATDVGPDTGSDGTVQADGSTCESPEDALVRVTFDLPPKAYTFDSQAWMIPPGNNVAVPCGSAATIADCCNPPAPAAPPDCAATPFVCEANVCTAKVNVRVAQDMDLKREVPALSDLDQPLLCNVALERLRFAATNTLSVSLPSLQLYLAPAGTRDPGAGGVAAFGAIPAMPAGVSTSGDVIRLAATDSIFASYGRAYGTPFTLIASATVSVPSGSPQPTGTLTLTISGQASATP